MSILLIMLTAGVWSPQFRYIRPGLAATLFALIIVAACGSDSAPSDSPSDQPTTAPQPLECEVAGYPCTVAEVSADILEKSDVVGDQVAEMLNGGTSTEEIATWLGEQDGVVEIDSDRAAVRFRLEGGRGVWILGEGAFGTRSSPGEPAAALPSVRQNSPAQDVVRPESESKKALVLSPVLWEFGEFDDGPIVAGILENTRGYEGGVNFLSNSTKSSSAVGVDSFKNWGNYDVIHVGTHGRRLCNGQTCRVMIFAGTLDSVLPPGPESKINKLAALDVLREKGVGLAKSAKTGTEYLILTADFFRAQYPGGLDDSLIFINACQTFSSDGTDLADALKGPSSAFLGWTDAVFAGEARNVARTLYEDLGERGYPVEEAYSRLGSLKTGTAHKDYGVPQLVLGARSSGDLHIREVVYLLNPDSGNVLGPSDAIRIIGEQGDGDDDSAPYRVSVDGITPEVAAGAILHVSIDGTEAEPQPVSEGNANGEDQWILGGQIDLGYDLEDERAVDYRAWVELPSGGESDHESGAKLTGSEPIMGYTWELEASWSRLPVHADGSSATSQSATARLIFEYDADYWNADQKPRYLVTGGTVTYNHAFMDRFCQVSADPVTFDVTPKIAGFSDLIFDLTVSPFEYNTFVETNGPRFEAFYACKGGSGADAKGVYLTPEAPSTRSADVIWMIIEDDKHLKVSAGAKSITGTYHKEYTTNPGSIVETNYTFTRIK